MGVAHPAGVRHRGGVKGMDAPRRKTRRIVGGWRKPPEGGLETGGRTTGATVRRPPLWKTAPPSYYES
jgi:hypothetical protein